MKSAEEFFEEWYESVPNSVRSGHSGTLYTYDRMKSAFLAGYKHGQNMG